MNVNKTQFHLVDLDFVAAMARVMQAGLKRCADGSFRVANGWKWLEWSEHTHDQYYSALIRHVRAACCSELTPAQRAGHWASVACNAMILWYHEGHTKGDDQNA